MKKIVLITATAILLITAGGCSSGRMASTGVYYDDIYYAPDLREDKSDQAFERVPSITDKEKKKELKKEEREQIREYEQSEKGRAQKDDRDFSEIQQKYASILADEDTEEVDTLVYHNEETGYWVDGFHGSSMDRSYAERLIRFHGPFTRIPYSSPLYREFVHFNDPYWNVYVDGHYAYAFPTWSNPWYDTYRFHRHTSPWSFGYGSYWGYSSFYGGYYDPFINPYHSYYSWGYHNPYYRNWYSPYHHNHAYYGYSGNKKDNREVSKGIKPNMGSNTRYAGNTSSSERLKTSRRDGDNDENTTMSRRGTRNSSDGDGDNASAENRENTRSSSRDGENLKSDEENTQRRSVTKYQGSGSSTGTVQKQSRRSSTPSYSQPENDSRPSYNRTSGYTRQLNTNTRSRDDNKNSETKKSDNKSDNDSGSDRSVRSRSRSYNSGSSDNRRVQTRSYQPSQRSKSSSSSNRFNNSNNTRSRSSSSYSGSSSSGSRSSGSSGSSSGSTIRSGRR
ncbi:MAG: hypothetical protein ACOC1E_02725 [Marinilabiliaceae bacterium]